MNKQANWIMDSYEHKIGVIIAVNMGPRYQEWNRFSGREESVPSRPPVMIVSMISGWSALLRFLVIVA